MWPLFLGQQLWALGCFVQQSRLVQGGGYVGLRLPRQADGLWEAVLEDSSGWMVWAPAGDGLSLYQQVGEDVSWQFWKTASGTDCLVVVTCPLLVMVSLSKWVRMSINLMGMRLSAWVSDIMGGLFSIYGA